ncbi:hypothetical protein ACPOL_5606 [Acidisarcina polymorpha]|uniref:Uncharacterized protein n=1 Tax=Acidisarcina polymorpha TaxID=2211140 RepID=A0A2Z5G828_9BACT|nr:hypothetical protein ACPOL_5606 [Acidisarcina polymorpha]
MRKAATWAAVQNLFMHKNYFIMYKYAERKSQGSGAKFTSFRPEDQGRALHVAW